VRKEEGTFKESLDVVGEWEKSDLGLTTRMFIQNETFSASSEKKSSGAKTGRLDGPRSGRGG